MAAYDEDLAYIHDAGYGQCARRSGPAILALLRRANIRSGLVVDLGCGSGILAQQLVAAGYDVDGIDASRAMLALARRRVPQAHFHQASVRTCALRACRAVAATGEVFNYAAWVNAGSPLRALERIFRRIHNALEPGGLLMFDLAGPSRSREMKQSHRSGTDWACLVDYEHDQAKGRLVRRIQTFRRVGNSYRRAAQTHRLQLFRGRDVLALLRRTGFRARRQRSYGDYPLPRAVAVFIARKEIS